VVVSLLVIVRVVDEHAEHFGRLSGGGGKIDPLSHSPSDCAKQPKREGGIFLSSRGGGGTREALSLDSWMSSCLRISVESRRRSNSTNLRNASASGA